MKKFKDLGNFVKKDKWRGMSIILFLILAISSSYIVWNNNNDRQEYINDLCNEITETPTWANEYGMIIGTGLLANYSENVVTEVLIPNWIYFIYDSNCKFCKTQIEMFGDNWEIYKEEGLTIDCSNIKEVKYEKNRKQTVLQIKNKDIGYPFWNSPYTDSDWWNNIRTGRINYRTG